MGFHEFPGNVEPQAISVRPLGVAPIHPVEPVEDLAQLFPWDAHPGVGHRDNNLLPSLLGIKEDQATLGGVLNGVVQQIGEDLFHPILVAPHGGQIVGGGQPELVDRGPGFQCPDHSLHEGWEIQRLQV